MAFKQGEVYRCPDPKSGCEVTVTKAPSAGSGRQPSANVLLWPADGKDVNRTRAHGLRPVGAEKKEPRRFEGRLHRPRGLPS